MSEATFTIPGPILDMLAKGLREMDDPPDFLIWSATGGAPAKVYLETDAGDVLTFTRAPEMERT